jgi:Protein phosphatase 2C
MLPLHILQQSGTTACIATVEAAPPHLLTVANVGDSRALLLQRAQHSSIWQAVQLTTDHKPDCESERQRVMSKGGRHLCLFWTHQQCSTQCAAQLVVEPAQQRVVNMYCISCAC